MLGVDLIPFNRILSIQFHISDRPQLDMKDILKTHETREVFRADSRIACSIRTSAMLCICYPNLRIVDSGAVTVNYRF